MAKWGICCCGRISQDFVTSIIEYKDPKIQVVAAAARNIERAQYFANKFNIKIFYGSYDELAQDPDIEIVYIGSINTEHLNQIKLFLNHGKHVLVEKPMCMSVAETEEAVTLARNKKLFLMEAVWSRCTPLYQSIGKIIRDGSLGNINHVNASFQVQIQDPSRIVKKELGGSGLHDIGIYVLQFAALVYPDIPLVRIDRSLKYTPEGVNMLGQVYLEFEGGKTAFLDYHILSAGNTCASIFGDKGNIIIPKTFWAPEEMILNGNLIDTFRESSRHHLEYIYGNSWLLYYEARHVTDCINKGMLESNLYPLDESLKVAKWIHDILEE